MKTGNKKYDEIMRKKEQIEKENLEALRMKLRGENNANN